MLDDLLRPTRPLPEKPNGYMILENASNLKRYWDILRGLKQHNYVLEIPTRTPPDTCRRAIQGVRHRMAGRLLDDLALLRALHDDESLNTDLEAQAINAIDHLFANNKTPISLILDEHYTLEFELVIAFTARRELILRADARYWPLEETSAPFPLDWKLRALRLRPSEYRMMIQRLSGLIAGR